MSVNHRLLSPAQVTLLRLAAAHVVSYRRSGKIDPLGNFADLPDKTIREIIATLRDRHVDAAEVFVFDDGSQLVGKRIGRLLEAVSPELGAAIEDQPFELSPNIVELAKTNASPQVQWRRERSDRRGFGFFGLALLVLAVIAELVGVPGRVEGLVAVFSVLGVCLLVMAFVLMPLFNRGRRRKVGDALRDLGLA
jgi:hypothetical protein